MCAADATSVVAAYVVAVFLVMAFPPNTPLEVKTAFFITVCAFGDIVAINYCIYAHYGALKQVDVITPYAHDVIDKFLLIKVTRG